MFHNPVIPGFAPDPSVVLVNGTFFLATSSFHLFPGIPIYASVDLQTWKQIGNAINRLGQLDLQNATTAAMPLEDGNTMVASGGLFAPTIRYKDGTFYIVCTNCYHGKDNWKTDNFIITTKDIWSNTWSDPVYFSFYGIDPSLFFDDDGRAYIQGSWMMDRLKQPSCTIKQIEIDVATGKHLSDTREIWTGFAKHDTEGPHIYKKDGWYYLLVAEGGTFEHHMLSIARASHVWGPYESYMHNPIMTADGTQELVQNVGHGELFQDTAGSWWATVLGVRDNNGKQPLGRETFLTPVDWPANEWPSIHQPRMSFEQRTQTSLALPPPLRDPRLESFSSVHTHVEDLFLHGPLAYNPYTSPTCIALAPTTNTLSSTTGVALLARRQRSPNCEARTCIRLAASDPHAPPVAAGLTVYKDPLRHSSIAVDLRTRTVSVRFVDASQGYDFCASHPNPLPEGLSAVELQIRADAERYCFAFRLHGGGAQWTEVGCADAALLTARDFTGAVMGVFASGGEWGDRVCFEKFEVAVVGENAVMGVGT